MRRLALAVALAATAASAPPAAPDWAAALGDTALGALLVDEPVARIAVLANISDATPGALKRTFMSPAHRRAANQLVAWFHDAGLVDARVDAVGNVRGGAGPTEAPGSGRDAGILLLGSHYDTVPNGGAYDGALGLVAALAAVKAVAAAGAAGGCGSPPPPASWRRRVEVVAFADEEGVRYGTTFLGSGALAGRGGAVFASARDAGGASPLDALRAAGLATSLADVQAAAIDPAACRGYVEAHAEQGPVLETSRARLAPVAAIAGQTRLRVAITGVAGHAGTVPMTGRRDAGAAAAAAAVAVEAACGGGPVRASPLPAPVMRALDLAWQTLPATVREAVSAAATATARRPHPSPGLVCTVGELALHPGAPNVIPGGALLTVDVRAPDDGARLAALARVRRAVASLCAARQVGCDVTTVHEAPASQPDMALSRALAAAAAASERGWARAVAVADAPRRDPDPGATAHVGAAMVSGAGHDALALAGTMPWAMLFVRDAAGVSHTPRERVRPGDVGAAAAALAELIADHVGGAERETRRCKG